LNQSRAQLVILDPFGDFIEASSPALLSKSKIMTIEELVLPTRDSRLLSEHASWAMCLLKNMNRSCVTFLIFNAKILVASIRVIGESGQHWKLLAIIHITSHVCESRETPKGLHAASMSLAGKERNEARPLSQRSCHISYLPGATVP
jgi:hypothetical protein